MNSMVLQSGVLSVFMPGSVLVLIQALSERMCFRANGLVFYPIVLYKASPR